MSEYQRLFFAEHGNGPWPCDFCSEPVVDLTVHHRDHDHFNDEIGNLGAVHPSCHTTHHVRYRKDDHYSKAWETRRTKGWVNPLIGYVHTEQTKQRVSEGAIRRYADPDKREASAASMRGIPKSAEHRANISTAQKQLRESCESCGETYRPCHRRYHGCS